MSPSHLFLLEPRPLTHHYHIHTHQHPTMDENTLFAIRNLFYSGNSQDHLGREASSGISSVVQDEKKPELKAHRG